MPPRRVLDQVSEHRASLDPVKRMVAVSVQRALVTGRDRPRLTGLPDDAREVTGEAVTALITEVTVHLDHGRKRTFVIKVSESGEERPDTPGA